MCQQNRIKWQHPLSCLWLAVCFIFLSSIPFPKAKETDQLVRIQYTQDHKVFQPIVIHANDEIAVDHPELYIEKNGYVSSAIWPYLSSRLTNGDDVVDMDVSEKRLLLCLSKNGQNYLRLAQWDTKRNDYITIDTDFLPSEHELDTYHDGDAVFLFVSAMESPTEAESAQQENKDFFLTFQQVENDWYLTSFTDGQTYVATLCDDVYLFDTYYESNPERIWKTPDLLPFSEFCITDLLLCLHEYHEATSTLD